MARSESFWRSDIQAMLRAIEIAGLSVPTGMARRESLAYRAGFAAALTALGAAFHVEAQVAEAEVIVEPIDRVLIDD